ncbi:hypothetical protein GNF10_20595 [Nostoc sp. UCD121]|uniref:hypothetical protein n=1 Tax=unclassified Nostoc TaxID=2593658 RepID=UPI001623A7D6|nr:MULTISPECIES: hypothetical protein [unclassified Nostoc]MBC1223288.1 hypothetical protein [Nostoc sp. UCD120]MBC1278296.1 hypothetical protein [Nostoc sp. UCD121]MBC1298394.1 hypothetical protein [Nostoc sp. UCD122]
MFDAHATRSPKGQWQSQRIEFITEQYLHGKSSKLILFVLCPLGITNDQHFGYAVVERSRNSVQVTNDQ